MKKLRDISKIFIYDTYDEPESSGMNNIEIAVSKDHNVYYENDNGYSRPYQIYDSVSFEDYSGRIFVPQFTAVEITRTTKTIVGITASPMHINHEGNVHLEILENKGLELCLKDVKKTIINNLRCKRNGSIMRGEYNYNGKNFNHHYDKYSNYLLDIQDETEKIENEFGLKLEYNVERFYDIKTLNVCDFNNLVYINNNGSRFINYQNPTSRDIIHRRKSFAQYKEYLKAEKEKNIEKNLIKNGNIELLLNKYKTKLTIAKTPEEKKEILDKIDIKINDFVSKNRFEQAAALRDLKNENSK